MLLKTRRFVWSLTLIFVVSQCIWGTAPGNAGEKEVIEVISTGIGRDSNEALKNALRSAVEQAVGSLVDSETLVENDDVVDDRILSYSAGFVESHKMLGDEKILDGGLVSVKIAAMVQKTRLTEVLRGANIQTKALDGQNLFGKAISKLEQKQSGEEMLAKAMEGYPENYYRVTIVDDPDYDPDTKEIIIKAQVDIDGNQYQDFTERLTSVIDQIATEKRQLSASLEREFWYSEFWNSTSGRELQPANRKHSFYLCTYVTGNRSDSSWTVFQLPRASMTAIAKNMASPIVRAKIVDTSGRAITGGNFEIPQSFWVYGSNILVFPLFCRPGNTITVNETYVIERMVKLDPSHAKLDMVMKFRATPEEMQKMHNITFEVHKGTRITSGVRGGWSERY